MFPHPVGWGFLKDNTLINGCFYFLNQKYFEDFPDPYLMKNKEKIGNVLHNRPCFYAFKESNQSDLFWLVPFSSQTEKYRKIYDKKIAKQHKCDTIVFGNILGYEKAFLIQNMCPATVDYISNIYIDKQSNQIVRINKNLEQELITKSKTVLMLQRKGYKLIFPDVLNIEAVLIRNHNNPQ